jgi:phosphoribosylformimino-5-aminoimidazole carboxamide ribotide isomerase
MSTIVSTELTLAVKIIPVIDLKNGLVVHARQGQREGYLPIHSQLCRSSDIYQVLEAFLSLYAFDTFYFADLDALMGQGSHCSLIQEILQAFPHVMFWLDQGYLPVQQAINYSKNCMPVLGSESYTDTTITELASFKGRFILSLDYNQQGFLGSQKLLNSPKLWPQDIIVMTLARVGGVSGPDFDKLLCLSRQYPNKNFIAAGGVRDLQDVQMLQQHGIQRALVASALHSGKLGTKEIHALQAKKYPEDRGIS